MEEDLLDFNFWPSFADIMLSLVLILLLVMFIFTGIRSIGTINLDTVRKNQLSLIGSVAEAYKVKERKIDEQIYVVTLDPDNNQATAFDIEFRNEPTLQRITFSDKILFTPDDYQLNPGGQAIIKQVGDAIKTRLSLIKEIQIQGHADTDATKKYPSNVQLAALRSIEVYKFLQDKVGINPAEHLMSATSFGEFKPVQRNKSGDVFDEDQLRADNATAELKAKNRRIELLIFYTVSKKS